MRNIIKRTIGSLMNRATTAIAGMAAYVADLILPNSVEADLPGKLATLNTADTAHKETVVQLKARRLELAAARVAAREFIRIVRELLKERLGKRYTQAWDVTGLTGRIALPRFDSDLLRVLNALKSYLGTHPIADAGANATALRAGELHDALADAIAAVALQEDAVNQAITDRDAKADALESALRILLSELHKKLTKDDSRWLAFGFNKPGAPYTPAIPQNLIAILIGANAISMKWDAAERATSYRVYKKVAGVDDDFVQVGSPADLDFTIEGLPGNTTVEVAVAAYNSSGQSGLSEVVTVMTV